MGQENSFSWDSISKGLPMQMEYLFEQVQHGKVCVKTLGETGRLFKNQYVQTPATAISALDDWTDEENQSVWYNSKNYRINIFSDKENIWIRDIHKFDEQYRDTYLDNPCTGSSATYDALPIVDGLRFSDDDTKCGLFFGKGKILSTHQEAYALKVVVEAEGKIIDVLLYEDEIVLRCDSDFEILFQYKTNCDDIKRLTEHEVIYEHNGFAYRIYLSKGKINNSHFTSEDSELVIVL